MLSMRLLGQVAVRVRRRPRDDLDGHLCARLDVRAELDLAHRARPERLAEEVVADDALLALLGRGRAVLL